MNWDDKHILVTGGTGSFGQRFVATMLARHRPKRLIVYSRDELKQFEMAKRFPDSEHDCIRFFIGDVRDKERLERALRDVDVVVHAAALKQIPACEYNPIEAVKTNIHGAENLINAAIDAGVEKVLALSTDKAVNPANLYGATKLVAEKLFVNGNAYSGAGGTRFACVRYGNVFGSRGSVIPVFLAQRARGRVTVTDERMTRFWITLDQGVNFVMRSAERMGGGEVFVPKLPSMTIMDVVKVVAPDCKVDIVGIRAGEKLHEVLISQDEARSTLEFDDHYVLLPGMHRPPAQALAGGRPLPESFSYASDNNQVWLQPEELRSMLKELA